MNFFQFSASAMTCDPLRGGPSSAFARYRRPSGRGTYSGGFHALRWGMAGRSAAAGGVVMAAVNDVFMAAVTGAGTYLAPSARSRHPSTITRRPVALCVVDSPNCCSSGRVVIRAERLTVCSGRSRPHHPSRIPRLFSNPKEASQARSRDDGSHASFRVCPRVPGVCT